MIWNDHSIEVPEGTHAFLGASQYSWLNYDEKKLEEVYKNKPKQEDENATSRKRTIVSMIGLIQTW